MTRLAITSTEHGAARVIEVSGEVDLSNVARFTGDVLGEARSDRSAVALVLDEVTYLDSTGIAALFKLAQELEGQQPLVLVVGATSRIRQLLKIAYVQERIPVYDDLQTALDGLAAGTAP